MYGQVNPLDPNINQYWKLIVPQSLDSGFSDNLHIFRFISLSNYGINSLRPSDAYMRQ